MKDRNGLHTAPEPPVMTHFSHHPVSAFADTVGVLAAPARLGNTSLSDRIGRIALALLERAASHAAAREVRSEVDRKPSWLGQTR
ncbi:hypothetical protein ACS8Y6_15600 [Salinisphaera sp. RV14]|uniref:hypothetical protein n=1 Tax=unclassified Salinisphaera TaxID=2649847 RepID=UPI003F871767